MRLRPTISLYGSIIRLLPNTSRDRSVAGLVPPAPFLPPHPARSLEWTLILECTPGTPGGVPESAHDTHATLVTALHPHPARSSRRRRGRKPQAPAPRRLCPPARCRHLLLSLPRQPRRQQDRRHRA